MRRGDCGRRRFEASGQCGHQAHEGERAPGERDRPPVPERVGEGLGAREADGRADRVGAEVRGLGAARALARVRLRDARHQHDQHAARAHAVDELCDREGELARRESTPEDRGDGREADWLRATGYYQRDSASEDEFSERPFDGTVNGETRNDRGRFRGRFRHHGGQGGLLPDSEAECAVADQWIEWCKTTPYRACIDLFWAIVRTEPRSREPAVIAAHHEALVEALNILEAHLAGRAYVAGDRVTMADIPLGPMVHRYFDLDVPHPDFPNLRVYYERLCERPAFREHAMIPFGRNPAEWYRLEIEYGA